MTDSWTEGALKMIWAYMIENGSVTTGDWSYYGGHWEWVANFDYTTGLNPVNEEMRAAVKRVGVDWEKTRMPESQTNSVFNGTFADSSSVESLLGTLVLKDGTTYKVGVDNGERRFHEYMKAMAEFAADKERVRNILGEGK